VTAARDRSSRGHDGLSPPEAARVYDRIGRLQDTQAPFERPALGRLVGAGAFEQAGSVVEIGSGTGSLARRLLAVPLPPTATYEGVEVSSHMVDLARWRIAPWASRARVVQTDGTLPLAYPDASADRVIAAYVLDLLKPDYAEALVREAHRLLVPDGLLCLASLTWGRSRTARIVSAGWSALWRRAPRLVGGCRPIELRPLLDDDSWEVIEDTLVESFGVPSLVVVAAARPAAG